VRAMRPAHLRLFQIYSADTRDAHHHRPYSLRASGGEADHDVKQHLRILGDDMERRNAEELSNSKPLGAARDISVALLTGGGDKPYAFGLSMELLSKGASLDLIGSDDLDFPEFRNKPEVNFLNLRGDQRSDTSTIEKVSRVLKYYIKLIRYAATSRAMIFHILWNNKFQVFDRTLLMLYYKLLRKKVAFTAHNVNAGRRDSKDTPLNRLTLRIQYRLADHVFVHTTKMKDELTEEFGVQGTRITVIPFGINNAVPNTCISQSEARQRLGIPGDKKTILFFGNITPYKGLEYLVAAFRKVLARRDDCRLIISGRPVNCEKYWDDVREKIVNEVKEGSIFLRADFIPDNETELYFKAADVLVLPYTHVYQSGVLFLGYSFGLPVLVSDVGSLQEEVIEGKTGFVFKPEDPTDLARTIERYFASDLFKDLSRRRREIRDFAVERHSWNVVGQQTMAVYAELLQLASPMETPDRETSKPSLDMKTSR
jgi:glycosyltransferase involved in cell wall biosynthesis